MSTMARETEKTMRTTHLAGPQVDVLLVYRSRGPRSFVNAEEISTALQDYCSTKGLTLSVQQATGSFQEQYTMYSGAKVLIAVHGASFANLMWMWPPAAVVRMAVDLSWQSARICAG